MLPHRLQLAPLHVFFLVLSVRVAASLAQSAPDSCATVADEVSLLQVVSGVRTRSALAATATVKASLAHERAAETDIQRSSIDLASALRRHLFGTSGTSSLDAAQFPVLVADARQLLGLEADRLRPSEDASHLHDYAKRAPAFVLLMPTGSNELLEPRDESTHRHGRHTESHLDDKGEDDKEHELKRDSPDGSSKEAGHHKGDHDSEDKRDDKDKDKHDDEDSEKGKGNGKGKDKGKGNDGDKDDGEGTVEHIVTEQTVVRTDKHGHSVTSKTVCHDGRCKTTNSTAQVTASGKSIPKSSHSAKTSDIFPKVPVAAQDQLKRAAKQMKKMSAGAQASLRKAAQQMAKALRTMKDSFGKHAMNEALEKVFKSPGTNVTIVAAGPNASTVLNSGKVKIRSETDSTESHEENGSVITKRKTCKNGHCKEEIFRSGADSGGKKQSQMTFLEHPTTINNYNENFYVDILDDSMDVADGSQITKGQVGGIVNKFPTISVADDDDSGSDDKKEKSGLLSTGSGLPDLRLGAPSGDGTGKSEMPSGLLSPPANSKDESGPLSGLLNSPSGSRADKSPERVAESIVSGLLNPSSDSSKSELPSGLVGRPLGRSIGKSGLLTNPLSDRSKSGLLNELIIPESDKSRSLSGMLNPSLDRGDGSARSGLLSSLTHRGAEKFGLLPPSPGGTEKSGLLPTALDSSNEKSGLLFSGRVGENADSVKSSMLRSPSDSGAEKSGLLPPALDGNNDNSGLALDRGGRSDDSMKSNMLNSLSDSSAEKSGLLPPSLDSNNDKSGLLP